MMQAPGSHAARGLVRTNVGPADDQPADDLPEE
jgi:hypothetical protein